jgi:hypothetical protein
MPSGNYVRLSKQARDAAIIEAYAKGVQSSTEIGKQYGLSGSPVMIVYNKSQKQRYAYNLSQQRKKEVPPFKKSRQFSKSTTKRQELGSSIGSTTPIRIFTSKQARGENRCAFRRLSLVSLITVA